MDDEERLLKEELGYTDEQWAGFQEYTHGYGEQDENGVDISLLRENLRLTPTERVRRLQQNYDGLQSIKHARRAFKGPRWTNQRKNQQN